MRDDLDVSNLATSTSAPKPKAAIAGLRQCVLAQAREHVHVTQVIALEHVPVLDVNTISFPLVLNHTQWYRKDVEMEVIPRTYRTKMLRVVQVSSCAPV